MSCLMSDYGSDDSNKGVLGGSFKFPRNLK